MIAHKERDDCYSKLKHLTNINNNDWEQHFWAISTIPAPPQAYKVILFPTLCSVGETMIYMFIQEMLCILGGGEQKTLTFEFN